MQKSGVVTALFHTFDFIRFNIETAFSVVCHHVTVMCKARLRPRSRPILARLKHLPVDLR